MAIDQYLKEQEAVALRKESVDRNPPMCIIKPMPLMSLSARRAWIEIIRI